MIHSRLRALTCLLAIPLTTYACASTATSTEEATDPRSCEPNPEAPSQQSSSTNGGVRPQGLQLNGVSLNGVSLNGVSVNGMSLNGMSLNGMSLNGMSLNGVSVNGVSLNGVSVNGVSLNGVALGATEIVGVVDGRMVHGEELVGAHIPVMLSNGSAIELTIAAFEKTPDPDVVHYRLEANGQNVCGKDGTGMFLPGVWDGEGTRHDELMLGGAKLTTSYSCSTATLAKCVVWGYSPWRIGAELHQACTRMTRADYCGHGVSFTKDETPIDIYDGRGIQTTATSTDAAFLFEAGWGPNGAVCVNRTRYDARGASRGQSMLPSCFETLPKCGSWQEAQQAHGAVAGNSSRIQSRTLCD